MTAVVLYLPGLSLLDGPALQDLSREYPRLARLLGRARCVASASAPESTLLATLGMSPVPGLAGLTALADFPDLAPDESWLRSDPVHLHADPNKVLVQGRVPLTAEDAAGLLGTLTAEFPELEFRAGRDHARWYVRRPAEVNGTAPSRHWLHGRSLTPFMPQGAEHRQWRRYLNDIQMVLHAHPVNAARATRGVLPLNAVWWFGAGPQVENMIAQPTTAYLGNDVLLAGLARATGQSFEARPNPEALLAFPRSVLACGEGVDPLLPGQPASSVVDLEREYLPLLERALLTRRLRMLTFVGATHCLHLGALEYLQLWRAPRRFHLE